MNSDIQEWLPPSDPAVFESLCLDLWKDIWQDASAQKNGGRGQNQDGVDVFGQSNGKWIGVQCKQKDGLLRTRVKPSELENEVKDACKFSPALHQFILATTGVRDAKVQERARQLTEQHKTKGLFSVEVWSWREIWPELCNRPNLLNRIGPQYWPHFFQKPLLAIHQLPPLPVLIGRDEELAVVEKILLPAVPCGVKRLSKWIGLRGMGGVGKTAFATALAHRFKDVYSDAQLYFDLRGADKERRLSAKCTDAMRFIIRTFHPNGLLPENQDELTALYRSVLSDAGRVLLLFDNAADAEQIRPLLPPPNCLLIVTSRKHFTLPGLIMHTIDCLKPDKAQELLVTNAPLLASGQNRPVESE